MRYFKFILLVLLWGSEKVATATTSNHPAQASISVATPKKPSLLEKRLLKQFRKQAAHLRANSTSGKNTLGTIALILAIISVIGFFIPSLAVILIFSIGALVTGIIALSKKDRTKGTKWKSIIAIIIGGLLTGFGILAALISAALNNFE